MRTASAGMPPVTPQRAPQRPARDSPGAENLSPNTPAKELRKQMALGNQLHAKKLSAMRQAYTQEIEELQDWTAALEDTLTNLVRSYGPCAEVLGSALQEPMRMLSTDSSSTTALSTSAIPGLSIPNIRVLAQVMKRTPSESSRTSADHEEGKTGISTELALMPEDGTKGFVSAATEARIHELEQQLQDLTENFVKQMCELKEENHQLIRCAQQGSSSAVPRKDTGTGHTNLEMMQGSSSDGSVGEKCSVQSAQVDQLTSQVDTLMAQLTEKENELVASHELNDSLQRMLERARLHERQWASRIDEEVDQALWSLNELSLDRARHSLERNQASEHVKKLNDLNEVVQKPIALIPQIRGNDLRNALDIRDPEKDFRAMKMDVEGKDDRRSTETFSRVAHEAGVAPKISSSIRAKSRIRQHYGPFVKATLHGIPEANEECSPILRVAAKTTDLSHGFDASDDGRTLQMEPEEPTFSPTSMLVHAPRAHAAPSCRQVTRFESMEGTVETSNQRYDGAFVYADPLAESFGCNHAGPEKPPRLSISGGAQHERGEDMAESVSFTFDALPSNHGAEAPPSTPVVEQQAEAMQMQSAQSTQIAHTRDCSAQHLFPDTSRANLTDQQAAEVKVLKALPEGEGKHGFLCLEMASGPDEENLQGPHHSNSRQIREIQKFNDLSRDLTQVIESAIRQQDVALAMIPDPVAASRSADKPPLRRTHPPLNHLAKNPVRDDPVKESSQHVAAMKQAPPGGKPRRPRTSAQEEFLCGGLGPGAPAVDVSRLHPKSALTQSQAPRVCGTELYRKPKAQSPGAVGTAESDAMKTLAGSKDSKSSIKKMISRFISGVRSMSPSDKRGTPNRGRQPSPTERDKSPSARSACGSASGRVEGNDGKSSRNTTTSSSAPNSPRISPSKRPSDDKLNDDRMHRFLQHSLLAARSVPDNRDAKIAGPSHTNLTLNGADAHGFQLPVSRYNLQSAMDSSRQHATVEANRQPRIFADRSGSVGVVTRDAGNHAAHKSLQKYDMRPQGGELRPMSSPSFRSLTSANDRVM